MKWNAAIEQFPHCLLCEATLVQQASWKQLLGVHFTQPFCDRCAKGFILLEREIDGVYCIYEYNKAMRDFIQRFKFMNDVYLAHGFRVEISNAIKTIKKKHQGEVIVIPIPMHLAHKRTRTFAQVDELLNAAQIPFVQVLEKLTIEKQSTKSRNERLAVKALFRHSEEVHDWRIILFDDIKTTGTTMKLAKAALMQAGAKEVICVALAARRPIDSFEFS